MLPFLQKKSMGSGVITKVRAPDEKPMENQDDDGMYGVEMAAKDLIDAVESKDAKRVASALKAAFEILDSMPHEEGFHEQE
jgi:hypothetical protein